MLTRDVMMDWSIFEIKTPTLIELGEGVRNISIKLRPRRMLPHAFLYYAAVIIDLALRLCWAITLVPPSAYAGYVCANAINVSSN